MQQQIFDLQQKVYVLLWNLIIDIIKNFKGKPITLENLRLKTKAKKQKSKMTRTNNIMFKRKNIETRGFDTNAHVSFKQSQNRKQAAKIIEQMTANKNKDGPETDEDEIWMKTWNLCIRIRTPHRRRWKPSMNTSSKFDKEDLSSENLELLLPCHHHC